MPKPKPVLSERRSVIVTFKPKDKRPDSRDKLEVVRSVISSEVQFFEAHHLLSELAGSRYPSGLERHKIGYDVNEYDAPIVTLSLNQAEINALSKNPSVAFVEEDGPVYALPYANTQSLVFEGQSSPAVETVPVGVQQIKAPAAWDASKAKGIKVAVLDTGIDHTHPDLAENVKDKVSFVPEEGPADGNGHGTHCAGTIAAALNGLGVVGVAPAASLYAVKVLSNSGSGNWSWLISGIDWCIKNGINVLSMSLGGPGAPQALESICNVAFSRGALLVAAAGNNGAGVEDPGRYANVITVSAIDSANQIAPFSSRGPEIDLCAPGVNVLSTAPGNAYRTLSGTSMACPHVAGAAALVWGTHRFATNVQIWNLLGHTADNLGVPGWDPLHGYGRVDAEQAALAMKAAPGVARRPSKPK
jgi:subtilisin